MAPELCDSRSEFSGQLADVWALGATMFMLRFGNPPFVAGNIMSLYYKILNEPLHFPHPINASLQDLLENMLIKDPSKRYSLAQTMKHPWMLVPPTPGLSAMGGEKSIEPSAHRSGTSASTNEAPAAGFQPPPSYDEEQKKAMEGPVHGVDMNDLFTSIGFGTQKKTTLKPVRSNGPQDIGAIKEAGDDNVAQGANNDDSNIMATKWGADVFDQVDDSEFCSDSDGDVDVDATADSDDDDDDGDAGRKYQGGDHEEKASPNKYVSPDKQKQNSNLTEANMKHAHNVINEDFFNDTISTHTDVSIKSQERIQMAALEQEDRARRFREKMGKKSKVSLSQNDNETNGGTVWQSSGQRRTTGADNGANRSPQANKESPIKPSLSKNFSSSDSKSPFSDGKKPKYDRRGTSSLRVSNDKRDSAEVEDDYITSQSYKEKESPDQFRKIRHDSLVDDDMDGDDDTNQLSMEDFEMLMDTLAMQPHPGLHATMSVQSIMGASNGSRNSFFNSFNLTHSSIPAQYCNKFSKIGGICASVQGMRNSQEDRYVFLPVASKESKLSREVLNDQMRSLAVAAVFDGHSGDTCAEYLKNNFVPMLLTNDMVVQGNKQLQVALQDTFRQIDDEVM